MIRQQSPVFDTFVHSAGDFDTSRSQVYGALAGQAIEESVTGFVFRAAGRKFGDGGDLLDPETANARFGVEGHLTFEKPVHVEHARQFYEIKQRELLRGSIIQSGNTGMVENLAVSLSASLIDPVGDAVAFLPYLGTSIKATHIARAGGRAMTLGRRLGVGAAEGFAAGLSQELVILPLAHNEHRDYGAEDMLLTLALSSGLGALARGVDLKGKHKRKPLDDEFSGEKFDPEDFSDFDNDFDLSDESIAAGPALDWDIRRNSVDEERMHNSPHKIKLTFASDNIDPNDVVTRPGAELVAGNDVPEATKQAAFQSAVKQVADGEPVTAAEVLEAGRAARMNEQLSEPGKAVAARVIKADIAYDAKGGETEIEYALVELDNLITSHTDGFMVDQRYPSVLQPRDRSAGAYQVQVREIASKLKPALLGENPLASDGAPIISPDGIVESGNGRTLALRMARNDGLGGWKSYQDYLSAQGYPVDSMDAPVLVRIAKGERSAEERVQFGQDANEDGKADFSVTERANVDAARIDDQALDIELVGDLSQAANRSFVTGVLNKVASANELPKLIDKNGVISADGLRRVKAALAAKAYDDPFLLTDILESSSPGATAINNALVEVAPRWAHMRSLARAGDIDGDMDITQELLNAITLIRQMRGIKAKGEKVTLAELEVETSADLYGPGRGAAERMMLNMFYGPDKAGNPLSRALSKEGVQTRLNKYIDIALTTKGGPSLFGANKFGESDAPAQRPKDILAKISGEQVPKGLADIRAQLPAALRQDGLGNGESPGASGSDIGQQSGIPARQENPASAKITPDGQETGAPADVVKDNPASEELTDIETANVELAADMENLVEGGLLDKAVLDDLNAEFDAGKLTALKKGLRAATLCVVKGGGS